MEKGISSLLAVIKRRALPAIATFGAVIGGAFAYLAVTPNVYQTSARLMLDDKRVSVSELGQNLSQVSSGTPGGASPLADQAELVKSQPVLDRAIAKVFPPGQGNPPYTVGDLSKGLKVKIVPATNILELNYQTKDANLAANILNAISIAMVEENTKAISTEATKVREFLEKEVPQARSRLLIAEKKENQYRQKSGIISFDEQSKSIVESLAALEQQERTLLTQLQEVRSRDASLRQITNTGNLPKAYSAVRSGQDEEIKKLRAKLAELEGKVIQARLKFTDNHPEVIKAVGEKEAIRGLYTQELARISPTNQAIAPNTAANDPLSQELTSKLIVNEVERSAIENKLKTVGLQTSNLRANLAQLPIKQQPLSVLNRQRLEAVESLKSLQSKLEEARIAEAQKVGNIRIIEQAQPPTAPAAPRRPIVLALATVFGSILATGVILLLEVLDNTLHDASEAEELLKLPLLGVLPTLPGRMRLLEPAENFLDNVGLVEPYRMLLKTLEFRGHKQLRLIVVSSTLSGEGKSLVASHLAAVSAMLSRRTLIIDADLRRPVQHRIFNLNENPGITDVIDGHKSLMNAVQKTEIENLSILTCGELYGRPSQLLESAAMKSLLAEAAEKFDLVIIDTPPLAACADAATLSGYGDGVMLVTRPGFTLKEILQKAVADLTHNSIPILGVVVNGMTPETQKYYRYPIDGYKPVSRPLRRLNAFGSK
ncbi:MAG: polysaccharide biosynthesis tyrosine autokinase [Cyanomargarita calcarea GSE-NOS-MK-12-04C]|jgi:capsular exopolysaccharide synthesis family protein|uniref:Polysaccharide biosynthesis tyrosine autokinase n=1 Tax=Cyanomargarita calcarea GSE-NOS-MK-12-04C TaxID=2839659 RepID=A0A951QQI2_9CYAN|nr:polysaccharide biosynthesis tyrosine autokinase [Cyanomargarita calcarea GSE-NOS-MK-12-04C]